jgi:DNA-directed RNA polymerase subunit RPC12/RpoP
VRCAKCGKKITETDTRFFDKSGVCMQCSLEDELEIACEVCRKNCSITEVTLFMRHYVCSECTIEDLLDVVHVTCEKCGAEVKLLNACEYRGKHACRECGLKMLAGEETPEAKKEEAATMRFLKWLGL